MKILGIGDLHINVWTKSNKSKHIFDTFRNYKKLIEIEKPDIGIIFGDLFDTKVMTSTEGLLQVINTIDELSTLIPIYIIVGNHDIASASDTTMSLPNVFKNKKNITVVDKYIKVDCIITKEQYLEAETTLHFLPYMKDKEVIEAINNIETDSGSHYLFGHFGVNGFAMNRYEDEEGEEKEFKDTKSLTSPTHLRKFKHVYLGHYHTYQSRENITYLGSPYELKHGEEFGEHGYLLIDTKYDDKFIINEDTPKHITFKLNNSNVDILKKVKKEGGHYIRIHVPDKISKEKLIKLRDGLLKNNFDVQFINEIQKNHEMVVVEGWDEFVKQDSETIIGEFLKACNPILKKNNWEIGDLLNIILNE